MTTSPQKRSAGPGGFTLVELLVSSAVLAIVLAVMFAALSTSMSLWRNTDNKIVADREARAIGLMMARDLNNVVIPASTNLWPIITNRSKLDGEETVNTSFLQFLTKAPADSQDVQGREIGDVCFVEYSVVGSTNGPGLELRRLFWPSGDTYTNIIQSNSFPTNPALLPAAQLLGLHLLPTNRMAGRGLGKLGDEANNTNFILLGRDMLPFQGTRGPTNYPVAIEVNFAVADPTTLANTNVINRTNYILRNAGLYSFRIPLPKPDSAQ